jgi:LSD1 subclass zinc finger protein
VPFAETCERCAAPAEHPIMYWRALLGHAHKIWSREGIGDHLAELEGERVRDADDLPGDFWAGPGHPLCEACKTPLADDAACPKCHRRARVIEATIATKVNRALRAIVIVGGTPPEGPLLVALSCPSCSGALDVPAGADQVKCKFCGTTSLVNRARGEGPEPRTAFLRFA